MMINLFLYNKFYIIFEICWHNDKNNLNNFFYFYN